MNDQGKSGTPPSVGIFWAVPVGCRTELVSDATPLDHADLMAIS
jgi:hypothetical protein